MKKIIFLWVFLIVAIFGSLIFFFLWRAYLSPANLELENCNTIRAGKEGAISLVFFGDSKEKVEEYVDYFTSLKPINQFIDEFSFYYIGSYEPSCDLYNGIAMLCYSRDLIRKAASCPNDHIIVLSEDYDRNIRSSTYLNVMSVNTKHPMSVLAHEFGHSFVNLAEEYVPATIPRNSAGNCVADCNNFLGKNDGCYEGCSRTDYFRSIEEGVMRTLRVDIFGGFNEGVIINKINELVRNRETSRGSISGNVIANERDCSKESYWLIEGKKINEDYKINRALQRGCAGRISSGELSYSAVLDDGSEVEFGAFNPGEIFTDGPLYDTDQKGQENLVGIDGEIFENSAEVHTIAPGEDGTPIEETFEASVVDFHLKIPAFEETQELRIKDKEGNEIVSTPIVDVSPIPSVSAFPFVSPSVSPTGSFASPRTSGSTSSSRPLPQVSSSPGAKASASGSANPFGSASASPSSSGTAGTSFIGNDEFFIQKLGSWMGRTISGWASKLFD